MLQSGLYEEVINRAIEDKLKSIPVSQKQIGEIDKAEASHVLSQYIAEMIKNGLNTVIDNGGDISDQVRLINNLVMTLNRHLNNAYASAVLPTNAQQLLGILKDNDPLLAVGQSASDMVRPETSIAKSSLFTGAIHEPQMFTELKKEIVSSDRIDMLVSFIKWSGLRLIIEELAAFTRSGGKLRIITTAYMGATDIKAIEELSKLPNTEIKVSYDTKRTRLHAKTYVFYRETGFSTSYIGSSNLSNAALSSGLEWNIKVTQKDLPETMAKIGATFESYWNSNEFETYVEVQKDRLAAALKAEKFFGSNDVGRYTFDIVPYSYQQEILDKLEAERSVRGQFKNLVVAATGTGKTVISAFDYKRFKKKNSNRSCRLLFVAHREEILLQSLHTFRGILKDPNFGEVFVGNYRPDSIEHLFISIQTFNSQNFIEKTEADYYDFIVVDEFHHAAAPTYQKLLTYYHPKILLGLTATPERMDGKNILQYFNNRIAAEIRLPEAIDRKLLAPFQYFGVTDTIDLDGIKWSRGGYDRDSLSNVYTMSGIIAEKRADHVIDSILKYVTDLDRVKGLGFCVSKGHAKFMADYFNEKGIPSIYLTGESPDEERKTAKNRLIHGDIRFIFVVDIYNEGVDIPEVNTVLFLRPTESLTVFLQQLGRGLRLAEGKECLTVLDFIGQANKKYNFEEKFAALLSNTDKSVQKQIKDGFISVPKGCYIQLEKKAKEYIFKNIMSAFGRTSGYISRIATFTEDTGKDLTLANFVDHYHLDIKSIYVNKNCFSKLSVYAGCKTEFHEPAEDAIIKAFPRFATINSRRFIQFILRILPSLKEIEIEKLSPLDQRMMQMFYASIWLEGVTNWKDDKIKNNIQLLIDSPVMVEEIIELLKYNYDKIDFIDMPVNVGFACPLDLYCTYTRDQIMVAMDFLNPNSVREGVKYLSDKKADIFFITLNKSDKYYSPTTMYEDYSINETLFHWQSQSTTAATSTTGQRYINHKKYGNRVLLFVREFRTDRISGAAGAYTYLGTASYVRHEGSKPMSITWKLDYPIPAKFLKKTNKLIAR